MASLSRPISALLALAALALVLAGCGKKGPLVPPEALVPAPVANLAVAQKGARFQVSWSAPGKQEGGATLRDLAGFLLFRRPLLPPAEDCDECPSAYRQLAREFLRRRGGDDDGEPSALGGLGANFRHEEPNIGFLSKI